MREFFLSTSLCFGEETKHKMPAPCQGTLGKYVLKKTRRASEKGKKWKKEPKIGIIVSFPPLCIRELSHCVFSTPRFDAPSLHV
jgi:hypothetical protein